MQVSNIWARRALVAALALCSFAGAHADDRGDWPKSSRDYANTNSNPVESRISRESAPRLLRAWETFNDSRWRPTPPPTGFVLESVLGLRFPRSLRGRTG